MGMFAGLMALACVVLICLLMRQIHHSSERKRLRHAPFPPEWEAILQRNVALYRHLPDRLREQLRGNIEIFLAEKRFEGCGGLEITDEIKVTIAAQACMLLLNRETDYFPRLMSILVYPSAYVAEEDTRLGEHYVQEESVRAGESWRGGALVLAWDHARHGAMDMHDGQNVVLHEFAHQLDQEDGEADGTPILDRGSSYVTWARILGKEYADLRDKVRHRRGDIMDEYGATHPAEFFAVATETFFEKPVQMKRKHPALYEELRDYYKLDPAAWVSGGQSGQ